MNECFSPSEHKKKKIIIPLQLNQHQEDHPLYIVLILSRTPFLYAHMQVHDTKAHTIPWKPLGSEREQVGLFNWILFKKNKERQLHFIRSRLRSIFCYWNNRLFSIILKNLLSCICLNHNVNQEKGERWSTLSKHVKTLTEHASQHTKPWSMP